MASKRNVIKATKSPMGPATCYTTNMTRCVIRPTYKGDGSYLQWLQGECKPLNEAAKEGEAEREIEGRKRGRESAVIADLCGGPRTLDSLHINRSILKTLQPQTRRIVQPSLHASELSEHSLLFVIQNHNLCNASTQE